MEKISYALAKKMEDEIIRFVNQAKHNLYFFGSGEICGKMLDWFRYRSLNLPVAICDNDPEKMGGGMIIYLLFPLKKRGNAVMNCGF